jgi:hypothetical protein
MNEWGNNPFTYQAIAVIVLSFGVVAIFIIAFVVWSSFRKINLQRKVYEDKMIARMRPWIGLFNCEFNLDMEDKKGIDELHLLLKNYGNLPAQKASLRTRIMPLNKNNLDITNPIVTEEVDLKVLLPLEEGNYKINLTNYPQFLTWKRERCDLIVNGEFLYSLSNDNYYLRFECILKFGIPNADNKYFKLNWRNQEVS